LIHALEAGSASQVQELTDLLHSSPPDKVQRVLTIFRNCGVDKWAFDLKEKYISNALQYLEDAANRFSKKTTSAKTCTIPGSTRVLNLKAGYFT
jgi:geranylgeranyl diphosphate synthase type II